MVSGRAWRRWSAGGGAGWPAGADEHLSPACCQGQAIGRCKVKRRADDAIRAGTVTRVRRMVAVVALASWPSAMVPAARARLNAMTAQTSQALLAVNLPLMAGARARSFSGRR